VILIYKRRGASYFYCMQYIRAHEILDVEDIRHGVISRSDTSTVGEFHFIPRYCKDSGCDCRKSEVYVLHEGEVVAVIDYGWETEAYYSKWSRENENAGRCEVSGVTITSKNSKYDEEALLGLFNRLMNEEWKLRMISHYNSVKKFYKREQERGYKPWQRLKVKAV